MKLQILAACAALATLTAGQALAADAITAKLSAPVAAKTKFIAGGAMFNCEADTCVALAPTSQTFATATCKTIADKVGVVAAFTKLQTRRGTFEMPYDGNVYVVDAITNNSGAGGGVLTTRDGFLLAMIGKEVRNAETNTWLNYSVPVTELRQTIRDIISGNFTSRDQQPQERGLVGRDRSSGWACVAM